MEQQIRFCTTADGVRIAYATIGKGQPLVKTANWLSHLQFDSESPVWRHWIRELSRYNLYVRYDERGNGLSDWQVKDFSFEGWVRDFETVVDSIGLDQFILLGISQGGPVGIAFAVRHPERVSHLILYGAYARGWSRRNLPPEGIEEMEAQLKLMKLGWGRDNPAYRQIFTSSFIPDATTEQMRWFNDLQRISTTPENAARFMLEFGKIDVQDLLPLISVPTLVLHTRGDARVPFEEGKHLAAQIPGARFVPLEGRNHILLEDEPAWQKFLYETRLFVGVEEKRPEVRLRPEALEASKVQLVVEGRPESAPDEEFDFESPRAKVVFDQLASDFLEDYMMKNYLQEKSGWRSIVEVAKETGVPISSLYFKAGGPGLPFRELLQRGLIESKISPGERGRGGEVTKIRVAYDKEPVKQHVNLLAKRLHTVRKG